MCIINEMRDAARTTAVIYIIHNFDLKVLYVTELTPVFEKKLVTS